MARTRFFLAMWMLIGNSAIALPSVKAKDAAPVFVIVHIDVMPQYTTQAVTLLENEMHDAIKDQGALSFKVLEEPQHQNHFTLVEEWADQDAYDRYVSSQHTRQFRGKIQPMLGSPFDERIHMELK